MIITNFSQSLLLKCTPTFTANIAKFAQFADTWCESREINQIRTNFNKSSIFLFKTLVRQDPAPCLHELRESRSLKLRFAKPPLLYSLHNILTLYILLQDNSLQFKATIYQCVITMDKNELILILQNANFPNFRPTFKIQAVQISGK